MSIIMVGAIPTPLSFRTGTSLLPLVGLNSCFLPQAIPLAPPLTLFPPSDARIPKPASTLAQHIHDLHAEIHSTIATSNDNYKLSAYVHHKYTYFEVGDFVMTRV